MAEIYISEIHEAARLLRVLVNRINILHAAIHTFEMTARTVHVPGFHVLYNIGTDNTLMLASLQDIRASIALTTDQINIMLDMFEYMRVEAERIAEALRLVFNTGDIFP